MAAGRRTTQAAGRPEWRAPRGRMRSPRTAAAVVDVADVAAEVAVAGPGEGADVAAVL